MRSQNYVKTRKRNRKKDERNYKVQNINRQQMMTRGCRQIDRQVEYGNEQERWEYDKNRKGAKEMKLKQK